MEKFTVFFANGGFQHNEEDQDEFAGAGLEKMIAAGLLRWPHCTPIAWAPDWPGSVSAMREESLAAGRIIELVDGKYVARSYPIPEQEPAPATTLGALLRRPLVWMGPMPTVKRVSRTAEPHRPALTWADPIPVERFPGYVVTRGTTEQPQPAGFASPDLQPASAQVAPLHGSAALLKG